MLDYEVVDTSLLYDVVFGVLNVDLETGFNLNILNSVPCTYENENDALCGDFKDTVIFGDTESLGGGQMITAQISLSACLIDSSTCSSEQRALLAKAENATLFSEFWARHK